MVIDIIQVLIVMCKTSKCASFANDFDTNSDTDLTVKKDDQLGSAVTLNHDGSFLQLERQEMMVKNNNKKMLEQLRLFKFMKDGSIVSAATGTANLCWNNWTRL